MLRLTSFVVLAAALTAPALAAIAPDFPLVGYVEFVKDGNKVAVPDAADGVYTSHNDTHLAYYGTLEFDPTIPTTVSKRDLATRQMTCDVSCNNAFSDPINISGANQGMANLLSKTPNFRGSIAYVFANVWAFGCDYGKGQTETVDQWNFDVGCTTAQCSTSGEGWNSHHQWKSAYGREFGGFVCSNLERS